jgi:hypothetical protein
VIHSTLMGRIAHADVFKIGTAADLLFGLFGGSGINQQEYDRRGRSVIPIFEPLLDWLDKRPLNLVLVHITAPHDVPFTRFDSEPAAAATWNAHVATELLEPWSGLPWFVCGFSGGVALALNGVHRDSCCFGGAALGADAIPTDFVCPEHWTKPLQLYVAPQDRVCTRPDNRRIVEALVGRGQAEVVRLPSGGHSLADYCSTEGLGELICHSRRVARQLS